MIILSSIRFISFSEQSAAVLIQLSALVEGGIIDLPVVDLVCDAQLLRSLYLLESNDQEDAETDQGESHDDGHHYEGDNHALGCVYITEVVVDLLLRHGCLLLD